MNLAEDFSIQYFPGYKIVTNKQADPPYAAVLYPCGTDKPAASNFAKLKQSTAAEIGFFEIPLYAVATDDSTAGWTLVRSCIALASAVFTHALAPLMPLLLQPRRTRPQSPCRRRSKPACTINSAPHAATPV